MSDKSDKDLADKLDAQDRLRARVYKKRNCSTCRGVGITLPFGTMCFKCNGKGYTWEAPIT